MDKKGQPESDPGQTVTKRDQDLINRMALSRGTAALTMSRKFLRRVQAYRNATGKFSPELEVCPVISRGDRYLAENRSNDAIVEDCSKTMVDHHKRTNAGARKHLRSTENIGKTRKRIRAARNAMKEANQ